MRMKNPPAWQSRAVGLKIRESNRLFKYSARPYPRKCALESYNNNNPARNSEGKLTWSEEYTRGFVESNGVPGNSAGSVPRAFCRVAIRCLKIQGFWGDLYGGAKLAGQRSPIALHNPS